MTHAEFNEQMRLRLRVYAVDALKFLDGLKPGNSVQVIRYQLAKSVTSTGANFRAFCRGRSAKERFAKICIVVEEADETIYWLEILGDILLPNPPKLQELKNEGNEILKIVSKIKSSHKR